MVEGARLESVYTSNRIVGSNPTLSAINLSFLIVKYGVSIMFIFNTVLPKIKEKYEVQIEEVEIVRENVFFKIPGMLN